jgi:hypothetical protein
MFTSTYWEGVALRSVTCPRCRKTAEGGVRTASIEVYSTAIFLLKVEQGGEPSLGGGRGGC